jgi:hypothetical protein
MFLEMLTPASIVCFLEQAAAGGCKNIGLDATQAEGPVKIVPLDVVLKKSLEGIPKR